MKNYTDFTQELDEAMKVKQDKDVKRKIDRKMKEYKNK